MPFESSVSRSGINSLKLALASLVVLGLLGATGCAVVSRNEVQAQPQSSERGRNETAAVETAIAQTDSLEEPLTYTGTTEPVQLVSLRSQAEGRLIDLRVDVGDPVAQGQALGQIDAQLLTILLNQAEAELAALESEVAQAQTEVSDAEAQVEQARVQLQQAQADAARLQSLYEVGAITAQEAEQAQTNVLSTEQVLRSAQERVRTREQAVVAAQGRVAAQRSAVSEGVERREYSSLTSPINGVVLERVTEPGNLVQPGDEVLKLGDFSAIKVVVQISELELSGVRLGQPVQVRLDAFPNREFRGQVTQISPAADPTARLIPVEVTMPNPSEQIGSGLLARVQFQSGATNRVVIPETALTVAGEGNDSTVFVFEGEGDAAKAVARPVQVGARTDGRVEIRSGLNPDETYIVRSSTPLQDGQAVRLSILSETN